jgi:hypothetical protein
LWIASKTTAGYGQIGNRQRQNRLAHRLSWELAYGPIPAGQNVLHRCDVPACVRPEHLFLGTMAANSLDMATKGRSGNAKLSAKDVRSLRTRYALGGVTHRQLAIEYGVTHTAIGYALRGTQWWRHVD